MASWYEETDPHELRARDGERFVAVRLDGFEESSVAVDGFSLPDEAYDVRTGTVASFSLDPVYIGVVDEDGDVRRHYQYGDSAATFADPVRLTVHGGLEQHLVVDPGEGCVELHDDDGRIRVTGDGRLRVVLGVQDSSERPTIEIPRSEFNLCRALSVACRTTAKTSPLRASPRNREQPAVVEWGDSPEIPNDLIRDDRPMIGCLVGSLDQLAEAMPLAAYLDAAVGWHPETPPHLPDPPVLVAADEVYPLRSRCGDRTDGYRPQNVFQTVFHLDFLAQTDTPNGREYEGEHHLVELGLDASTLVDAPIYERLNEYLSTDTPPREILDRFPDWHHSVSVEPTLDRLRRLIPYLHHLPVVEVASHTDVESTSSTTMVDPEHVTGRTHGWYAPHVPTEGYKLLHSSLGRFGESTVSPVSEGTPSDSEAEGPFQIVVVTNADPPRDDEPFVDLSEGEEAEEHYSGRADDIPIDVKYRENASVDDLASHFERDVDLVHFVGHCDAEHGLRCPGDRYLSAGQLSEVKATTFVLNASESIQQGRALIRQGATGGVVTVGPAVTPRVGPVGVALARLLAYGWPLATALDTAEHANPECDRHVVIGDGTTQVAPNNTGLPPTVSMSPDPNGNGEFEVDVVYDQPILPGTAMWWKQRDDRRRFAGRGTEYRLDADGVRSMLGELTSPVLLDGELVWPEDVRQSDSGSFAGP
ncbi:hypothetical protein RYH80_03460 [Halobaculum sp. MBLA0147]|uniref:hypothetical protein n=1 Tax=Halobaculum sp. MBLA0147 TaxID=3079934 RepID=UPI0035264F2D